MLPQTSINSTSQQWLDSIQHGKEFFQAPMLASFLAQEVNLSVDLNKLIACMSDFARPILLKTTFFCQKCGLHLTKSYEELAENLSKRCEKIE